MPMVQSMGFGVQSVTIAAMACHGDLPMPDFAVFADPGWESGETYSYKDWFTGWASERGLRIVTASKGNIRKDALSPESRFATMPLWTMMDGSPGLLRRQCTREYKVEVVAKAIRAELGLQPRQRVKEPVEVWLGISLDEVMRMKDSRIGWLKNAWPLIDKRMTRGDCIEYLKAKGLPVPPKSSCIGCPFHNDNHWRRIKAERPEEFADAVDFDARIRKARVALKSAVFLHRSLKPLGEVDFTDDQVDMFNNECEGHCGL